ncbi:F-box/FBD/LRR-repeat protein At1g16930 [Linum perenne]
MKNNNPKSCKSGKSAKKRHRGEGCVDRFSNLLNLVLHHILSFLDTKETVLTSLLSRRWRCSWKHVHVLVFDFNSFD